MQRIVLLVCLVIVTGCASVMNPYSSDFSCPETNKGKCVSVKKAYSESMETNPIEDEIDYDKDQETMSASEISYQDAMYQELAGLLNEPVTPIVAPPKVMRVLLLPYRGDKNELYMYRYVYFFVDKPKWVLGDYLSTETEDEE